MTTPEPTPHPYTFLTPGHPHDPHEAVRAWQAHLDAGRIGHTPPVDPALVANTARAAALFRSFHKGGTW